VFVEPVEGQVAVGLHLHGGQLWVAGGATGAARVYDATTGELLDSWQLATGTTFINDVVVAGDTAWFTDSRNPVLYGVRVGDDQVTTLPLSGDLQFVEGINTNGIEATPDGATLVVVQSPTGLLFTVDPATGVTNQIDLGGETVINGDGLLFDGGFLYVVQNQRNEIARIELSADLSTGTVLTRLTDPDLNVPTTVGAFAGHLWAVNARFGTTPTPDTFYSVIQVRG
jgi:sugar lactone lactonase YvrE